MDSLSNEVLKYFQGYAQVRLPHLYCKDFCEMNVRRYLKLFEAEGCSRQDPQHSIAAIINAETLSQALRWSMIEPDSLLVARNFPMLSLDGNTRLLCLQGQDLLEAARRFLPPGQKWWVVRLYLDGSPPRKLICGI